MHLESTLSFAQPVLPHRLSLIKTVHMDLEYHPEKAAKWAECWRIVANFKQLQELQVRIKDFICPPQPLFDILDTLRAVRAKVFEVLLQTQTREGSPQLLHYPFVLTMKRFQTRYDLL